MLLKMSSFEHYIDQFNQRDEESVVQYVDNASALKWLESNIAFFECPDKEMEEVYYFRWWVFRKHIKKTVDGFIITEFQPEVPWSGRYNSIVCPAGHHFYEGRWLNNPQYLYDYALFWYKKNGELRAYSSWLGNAIWGYCKVQGDFSIVIALLDDLVVDYREWELSNLHVSGLFWSNDDRDGGEFSISSNGLRPTLNAYMYGYATIIAKTAEFANQPLLTEEFTQKAENLKKLINERLWDKEDNHYKVYPLESKNKTVEEWSFSAVAPDHNVRELLGYIPWYFDIPENEFEASWSMLMDKTGFYAPFGPTTAEQTHPRFMFTQAHECLWNGPSWPFATSMTLTAMANLLNNNPQNVVSKSDYLDLLSIYTASHSRTLADGTKIRWLDENLNPYTGEWTSRAILQDWGWQPEKGGFERGKDYNHSSYCDLIITGLVGLRPRENNILEVSPLIPEEWEYYCLDYIHYHGYKVTIMYDKTGGRYLKGIGLHIYLDGILAAHSTELVRLLVDLENG
jgi:hypothetical protein